MWLLVKFESLIQPFYFDSQTINTVKLMYICIDIYTNYYRGGIYSGFDRACCIISNTSTGCIYTGRTGDCRLLYGDCKVDDHNLFDTCNPHVLIQMTAISSKVSVELGDIWT